MASRSGLLSLGGLWALPPASKTALAGFATFRRFAECNKKDTITAAELFDIESRNRTQASKPKGVYGGKITQSAPACKQKIKAHPAKPYNAALKMLDEP